MNIEKDWILPANTSVFDKSGMMPEIVENNDSSFLHSKQSMKAIYYRTLKKETD
jgi:hypothetical protein